MINGYFKNELGQIVATARDRVLIPTPREGFTFVECSKAELAAIEIFKEPLTKEETDEQEIQTELRNFALERIAARKSQELGLL